MFGFYWQNSVGNNMHNNKVYEIDLSGAPPVDPFVPILEDFDQSSYSSHVNVVSRRGTPAKRLMHAKAWLRQNGRAFNLSVDTCSACNLMLLSWCKRLGVVVQLG